MGDDEESSGGRPLPGWLVPVLAAAVLVVVAILAFRLFGGSDDPAPTTTSTTETSTPTPGAEEPTSSSTDTSTSTSTSTTTTAVAIEPITLSGVAALPGDGAPCAEMGDGHVVRVVDETGERLAVTPLIDPRENGGRCEFDYWVRLRTNSPTLTFTLLDPGDAPLDEQQVERRSLASEGAPTLSSTDSG